MVLRWASESGRVSVRGSVGLGQGHEDNDFCGRVRSAAARWAMGSERVLHLGRVRRAHDIIQYSSAQE
jgi:hypothetical protein